MDYATLDLFECRAIDTILSEPVGATESFIQPLFDKTLAVFRTLLSRIKIALDTTARVSHGDTELSQFLAQHSAAYRALTQSPLSPVPDSTVFIPAGMIGSYLHTSTALFKILSESKINPYLVILQQATEFVSILNRRASSTIEVKLDHIYTTLAQNTNKNITQLQDNLTALFDASSQMTLRAARKEFPHAVDVRKTTEAITQLTRVYSVMERNRATFYREIADVDKLTHQINPMHTALTLGTVNQYMVIVTQCAKLLRVYGLLLSMVQAVEHQYVNTLAVLCKK